MKKKQRFIQIIIMAVILILIGLFSSSFSSSNNSSNNLHSSNDLVSVRVGAGGGSGSGGKIPTGVLDTTFGGGDGIVVHNGAAGGNGDDDGFSIYVDSVGRIYVTGESYNSSGNRDMVIWRYDSNGNLDRSFGGGDGIVVHSNAAGGDFDDRGNSIYVDSRGRIYVTGWSWNGRNRDMVIWRYDSNGNLDRSFGNNGIVVHNNAAGGNGNDGGNSIYVDSRGRIYVTGWSYNSIRNDDMVIWRYR